MGWGSGGGRGHNKTIKHIKHVKDNEKQHWKYLTSSNINVSPTAGNRLNTTVSTKSGNINRRSHLNSGIRP